jgi:hypothetical protein
LNVVFLFASGQCVRLRGSLGELSEGFAMTGKRGLWRARSSSCSVGEGAVASVVLRDVGCPEALTSPVSFPVPAGISKSGASPFAALARDTYLASIDRNEGTDTTDCLPSSARMGLEQRHAAREIAYLREPSGERLRRIGNGEGGDGQTVVEPDT